MSVVRILKNDLGRIGKAYRQALDEESEAAADLHVKEWKSRAHEQSGDYLESIRKVKQGDRTYLVTSGVPYDIFEEYGTVHRPPHPAFEPAKEIVRQQYPERTRKRIGSIR